jgi:double-strand break repair protein MRE11
MDDKVYHISQPGSSVATSLTEGEAKEKCVGILKIRGKKFAIEPVRCGMFFFFFSKIAN